MDKSIPCFEEMFDEFKASDSFFSDQVKTISFTITTAGAYDRVTGVTTGGSDTVYAADVFQRDVKDREFRSVEVGDKAFTCKQSDLAYTPKVDDVATINGVAFNVIEVEDAGSAVYKILLRA